MAALHALTEPVRDAASIQAGADADAPEWDGFVAAAPGGDLVQTSAWALAKRALGLEVRRVVVRSGREIAGGGQIAVKRIGRLGAVGYVARGPLVARGHEASTAEILDGIERAARAARVRHLIVQPPEGGDAVAAELAARGYTPDGPEVAPSATLRIDLSQSLDQIFACMSSSKRYQVRRGEREGLDRLQQATARRQGFAPRSRAYLEHHWDALHPHGLLQLIFACHEGRALAAVWLTAFGKTVTHRLSGSNLEAPKLQPNVGCRWAAIRWAKEQGFDWFDFGGVERRFAELMLAGQPLPECFNGGSAAIKREFGSRAVLLPPASQRTFNPIARPVVRFLYPKLAQGGPLHRLVHRLRNG